MAQLIKDFDNFNFSVAKYTKELVKECVGGLDLQQRKMIIEGYNEQTSATLKQTCKKNYIQFIQTAKEISHLESEMYLLSHILSDQRNILTTLSDGKTQSTLQVLVDATGESRNTSKENEYNHATRAVKEMVQGFQGNLEGKTFLNEGALIELDSNDYRPIQRVFFFLFNDVLIVCKVKYDKRLEFIAEYNPKKIAVINIKDLDGVKNAINIITPEGSKIFQSITVAGKNEWIEKLEEAFRFDQHKNTLKVQVPQQPPKPKQDQSNNLKSYQRNQLTLENNTFQKNIVKVEPQWVCTANEEIQTLIAQRHFEDAQSLIKRARDYLQKDFTFFNALEICKKIDEQEAKLTDVLLQELSNCHCHNLQVALRNSKRCLKILVEIGRSRQASSTLLKVCSVTIRTAQREARRNNVEISELFFCDLTQVVCDFLIVFEHQPACTSALIVWCNAELHYFASQLIKHYLTKGSQLETISKYVEHVRKPCAKLNEIGLDLNYHLEGLLRSNLESLIEESRVRLIDAVGRTDETWQPYNLHTKTNLKRLLTELDSIGIDIRDQTTGDTWVNLTQSTVVFIKHYLQLTEYCGSLSKSEVLQQSLENLLKDLILSQQSVRPPPGLSVDPNFVVKNKMFIIANLLPISIKKFSACSGRKSEILKILYAQLLKQQAQIPKQRSIYQTDVF